MLTKSKSDLKTDGSAPGRFRARGGQRRGRRAGGADSAHGQALVTADRRVIEMMEVLADILACVFAESQEAGKIDIPNGSQVADTTAVQTKEQSAIL